MAVIAEVSSQNVVAFAFFILLSFFALFAYFVFAFWVKKEKKCLSPYSGRPLRPGSDVPLSSVREIMQYLYYMEHSYDNRVFGMKKAMVCRETGRIFPDSVSVLWGPHVDWGFLKKHYSGNWISWGSLTYIQQQEIREHHDTLEGFQTEHSSPSPSPRAVEPEYALAKPGPLYVDLSSYVLLGWKCVPDTDFEVLVVQKPRKLLKLGFKEKKNEK